MTADWIAFDAFHMPPANESLDLEIEVNDFGRTTNCVTNGYYDGQLGHFRRLVGPIGRIEENVLRWKFHNDPYPEIKYQMPVKGL
jgi:hypothetical protein